MRKVAIAVVISLAVVGAALVLLPFDRPTAHGSLTYGPGFSSRCSSPVVAAWQGEHDAGWFGYTSLTSTPLSPPTCRGAARHRLAWGCGWLSGAAIVTLVLRRRPRAVGTTDDETMP